MRPTVTTIPYVPDSSVKRQIVKNPNADRATYEKCLADYAGFPNLRKTCEKYKE